MKATRILVELSPGFYKQTDRLLREDGQQVKWAITNDGILTADQVNLSIHPIIKNPNMGSNYKQAGQVAPAMQFAETPNGQVVATRNEANVGVSGSNVRRSFKIVIDNPTAGDLSAILGDGSGLITLKLKGAAQPVHPGLVVTGQYGIQTAAILAKIAAGAGLDFHGLHLAGYEDGSSTASAAPFDSGKISVLSIAPDYQTVNQVQLPLSDMIAGGDFRDNIREDKEFRFTIGMFTAMEVIVPAGSKLILTFKSLSSVSLPGTSVKLGSFYR